MLKLNIPDIPDIPKIPRIPEIRIMIQITSSLWFRKCMTLGVCLSLLTFSEFQHCQHSSFPEVADIPDIPKIPIIIQITLS